MPGLRMSVQKGRAAMVAGLCLAIFILLLACLDNQSHTLEPFLGSGDRYTQARGRAFRNTAGFNAIARRSQPESVSIDSAVQRVSRRSPANQAHYSDFEFGSDFGSDVGSNAGSDFAFDLGSELGSDAGSAMSMASVDEQTWQAQVDDGKEGRDPAQTKQDWDAALKRGQDIEELWTKGSTSAGERTTLWKYDQIKEYGWVRTAYSSSESRASEGGVQSALNDLPIKSKNAGFTIRFDHKRDTNIGGKSYPATRASYELSFRLDQHAIVLNEAEGPAYTEKGKKLPPEQLVPLRHVSDFAALEWQNLCSQKGVDPSSLKYVIHDNIYNVPSRNVARTALGGGFLKTKGTQWPGLTFTADDAAGQPGITTESLKKRFQATIGAPNGLATAQILLQRPDIVGVNRRIVKATLWIGKPDLKKDLKDAGPNLYMLFEFSSTSNQATGTHSFGSSTVPGSSNQKAGPANLPGVRQV